MQLQLPVVVVKAVPAAAVCLQFQHLLAAAVVAQPVQLAITAQPAVLKPTVTKKFKLLESSINQYQ